MSKLKRKVFYISGFDPRGARFYHQLYNDECRKYAALKSEDISVSKRSRKGKYEVVWEIDSAGSQVDYSFLCWDDIIRKNWIKNPLMLLLESLLNYILYAVYYRWNDAREFPRGVLFTYAYPLISLLGIWGAVWFLLHKMAGDSLFLVIPMALLSVFIASYLLNKIKTTWLLRFFIFNRKSFIDKHADIDVRVAEFVDIISEAVKADEHDEILLISHSNGTIITASVMYGLYQEYDAKLLRKIKVVTFGQCIPLVSCYKKSVQYNANLQKLSAKEFYWLDVGAPADGACISLMSPFFPYDDDVKTKLLSISPQFHKSYDEVNYKRLRRNKFELHFQYLYCADKLSVANYFGITTSNSMLEDKFDF